MILIIAQTLSGHQGYLGPRENRKALNPFFFCFQAQTLRHSFFLISILIETTSHKKVVITYGDKLFLGLYISILQSIDFSFHTQYRIEISLANYKSDLKASPYFEGKHLLIITEGFTLTRKVPKQRNNQFVSSSICPKVRNYH